MSISRPLMHPVTPAAIKQIAAELPVSGRIFVRISALAARMESAIEEIVELVRLDPALSAAVLRVANSSYYRRGLPAESVAEAITRVGFREVSQLVGQAVASQLFFERLPHYQLDGDTLWQNAIFTAAAMAALARAAQEDENTAYTLGLLRVCGRLALQRQADSAHPPLPVPPKPTGPYPAHVAEREWERAVFRLTHPEAGGLLLAEWGFPPVQCAAIRWHLHPAAGGPSNRLAARLHLASGITDALGRGLPSEHGIWKKPAELTRLAELDEKAIRDCLGEVRAEGERLAHFALPSN